MVSSECWILKFVFILFGNARFFYRIQRILWSTLRLLNNLTIFVHCRRWRCCRLDTAMTTYALLSPPPSQWLPSTPPHPKPPPDHNPPSGYRWVSTGNSGYRCRWFPRVTLATDGLSLKADSSLSDSNSLWFCHFEATPKMIPYRMSKLWPPFWRKTIW